MLRDGGASDRENIIIRWDGEQRYLFTLNAPRERDKVCALSYNSKKKRKTAVFPTLDQVTTKLLDCHLITADATVLRNNTPWADTGLVRSARLRGVDAPNNS